MGGDRVKPCCRETRDRMLEELSAEFRKGAAAVLYKNHDAAAWVSAARRCEKKISLKAEPQRETRPAYVKRWPHTHAGTDCFDNECRIKSDQTRGCCPTCGSDDPAKR